MLAFVRGESDVLLCTTIIESGLDMPRANTILIDRADALGLAQLYQLRGRVGRSRPARLRLPADPRRRALTDDARAAARGDPGSLRARLRLPAREHGPRDPRRRQPARRRAVRQPRRRRLRHLHARCSRRPIDELRGEQPAPRGRSRDPPPIAARLPEELRRRRAAAPRALQAARERARRRGVDRLRDELLDRFGPLPPEAENLLGGDPPQDRGARARHRAGDRSTAATSCSPPRRRRASTRPASSRSSARAARCKCCPTTA